MNQELTTTANNLPAQSVSVSAETMELVLGKGDLSKLTPGQRVEYLGAVCKSLGLNPLTQPFSIQDLGGKTVLYAKRDCTDQLRQIHGVTIESLRKEKVDDIIMVTATAVDQRGRRDQAIGAVSAINLKGEALANAMMKAETKAKRRVTLSLCGLGVIDEMEVDAVQAVESKPAPFAAVARPWKTKGEMKQMFSAERERVGDVAYYRVLEMEGLGELEELKTPEQALLIYSTLQRIGSEEVAL